VSGTPKARSVHPFAQGSQAASDKPDVALHEKTDCVREHIAIPWENGTGSRRSAT